MEYIGNIWLIIMCIFIFVLYFYCVKNKIYGFWKMIIVFFKEEVEILIWMIFVIKVILINNKEKNKGELCLRV